MPLTIVSGGLVDLDDQVHDTPRNEPPKLPTETESRRNIGCTVFGETHEVGYARVSKREQTPGRSGCRAARRRLQTSVRRPRRIQPRRGPPTVARLPRLPPPGDTLKVRRLDRLAGSERVLIETLQDLDAREVNIGSLTEPMIDTTTPMGRALYVIVAVFAQLRVDTVRENTNRGLDYARTQGRVGGRPSVMTPERIATAERMRAEHQTWESIGRVLRVGATSVRRSLMRTP